MNISELCINRPIATSLLTFGLALAGILAFFQLPVAPLPQVDFPTLSVQANLPGASPEVMAATVATPLERALGTIAGVNEMTSSSTSGATRISLQFDIARDIDGAARDVQAAINAAQSLLPPNMPIRPNYRKVSPGDSPIMIIGLTSEIFTREQMYDVASTLLSQKIAQIPGVGQVTIGGSSLPSVHVAVNPSALAKYNLSLENIRQAINSTNVNRPKGLLEDADHSWQIAANDQAKNASDYLPMLISYKNGAGVRLTEVGTAVDSAEDIRNVGYVNNKPAVLLLVYKQSGANIIATVDKVNNLLPHLQASVPQTITVSVALDRSTTIRASLVEVEHSLLIAIGLVIIVVLFFLGNLRSAIIPIITVPLSLIGTFGIMYLCDYSLDNLSLMALTIATGFVVDDVIVVLENTTRYIEQGIAPKKASLTAVREVSFTIVSMSLSLIAVFIPILFMGGVVGRLFQEFAVTLSGAVILSLLIALTTTPMLCAIFLKREQPKQKNHIQHLLDYCLAKVHHGYAVSLRAALAHPILTIAVLVGAVFLNIHLYKTIPKGFFPIQDTGRLSGTIVADQNISFQAMQKKLESFIALVRDEPEVKNVLAFIGGTSGSKLNNVAQMFVILKPKDELNSSIFELQARYRKKLSDQPGASLYLQPIQEIRVGARASSALFEYTLQAEHLSDLKKWTPLLVKSLGQRPELLDVNTDQQDHGQKVTLEIDRQAVARLGISMALIDNALYDAFGQRQTSIIYEDLNQYHVILEVAPEYARNPDALKDIYIKAPPSPDNPNGTQIPLATISHYRMTNTALSVAHQGQLPSSTFSFNLKPGVSLSIATQIINEVKSEIGMPASMSGSFQGTAKAFEQSLDNQPILIWSAIGIIYIVLGILYESYIHPITILSTLPSAGVGALLALLYWDAEFSVIAMIGVILLIGIVKKNAIMMIDFALNAQRQQLLSPKEAIYQACLMRFRPIMMTTCAALFAAIPLAIGTGYGAELRSPLGIAIIGGLLFSQLLTLYTTPVIYIFLDRLQTWCISKFGRKPLTPAKTPLNDTL